MAHPWIAFLMVAVLAFVIGYGCGWSGAFKRRYY